MRSTVEKPEAAPVDLPIEWTVPWERTHGPCKNNPDCGSHPDFSRAAFGMPGMTKHDLCIMTRARRVNPCTFYKEEYMDYREKYAKIHGVDPHAQPDRRRREFRRKCAGMGIVCGRKKARNWDMHISENKDVKVEIKDKDNNSDVDDSDDDLNFSDNEEDDYTI